MDPEADAAGRTASVQILLNKKSVTAGEGRTRLTFQKGKRRIQKAKQKKKKKKNEEALEKGDKKNTRKTNPQVNNNQVRLIRTGHWRAGGEKLQRKTRNYKRSAQEN